MTKLIASYKKYTLIFKRPSGTSRGILKTKDSWFIHIKDANYPEKSGLGECSLIPGLSPDDLPGFESRLKLVCSQVTNKGLVDESLLKDFPAIRFGLETALHELKSKIPRQLYPSEFTSGKARIPINGLIWMGSAGFMKEQIDEKIKAGFNCLKLKIGAIDFDVEVSLLKSIRQTYTPADLELRVDANGAFQPHEALEKLKRLSAFSLHSIEQPIKPGQPDEMARLCARSPVPVALDEELIGIHQPRLIKTLLQSIRPQYIILKPSLLGGLQAADEWIASAREENIGWWATSALESNIGLNAIAQWVFTHQPTMLQGLGTGQLFTNNIVSPLFVEQGHLAYAPEIPWDTASLFTR